MGATAAMINQNEWRRGIESLEWCSDCHHETAANKPFQFEKCAGAKSSFLGTASRSVSGLPTWAKNLQSHCSYHSSAHERYRKCSTTITLEPVRVNAAKRIVFRSGETASP
jgi:hypothetical protein